jgi:DNA-binding transcriptional ArsR family regulator
MRHDLVFKALADKTRRKIIRLLRERDMNAGEIAAHFSMSKPSISEHLKILRHADLVDSEKQGQYVTYFLNASVLESFIGAMLDLFGVDVTGGNDEENL